MEIFKYIIALYFFFAALLGAISFSVALSFPHLAHYAYSIALTVHSFVMFGLFLDALRDKEAKKEANK